MNVPNFDALPDHVKHVLPCHMDQWPDALWALTAGAQQRRKVNITQAELDILFKENEQVFRDLLLKRVAEAMTVDNQITGEKVLGRWFARLNTRSPKDITAPLKPVFHKPQDVVNAFLGSERTIDDMVMLRRNGLPCAIYFLPVIPIPDGGEFRCFVKDTSLIGISQYEPCHSPFPRKKADFIIDQVKAFAPKVCAAFNQSSFVFDVWFYKEETPFLLEVNPYGLSDPCLFESYETLEKKGGYRFYQVGAKPL